jgi:ABC-type glutathione transport system ATPase component/ABC-type dipeptide/oligopeptide/nickel transport system permease subunit
MRRSDLSASRTERAALLRVLRTPVGAAACLLATVLIVVAVIGPWVWGAKAVEVDVASMQQGVSGRHLLGTDALGRDVFARVLVATRLSVGLAALATLLGAAVGVVLGALPSVLPRFAARAVVALIDLLVGFPGLLLALFLAVVFGVGAEGAVLALATALAPGFARLTRVLAASVTGADYVAASRQLGVRGPRLLARHVLPNVAEPLIVTTATAMGGVLLAFAGLSFLGFGVQSPSYDWGQMLNEGLSRIYLDPAAALGPGVAVMVAGVTFTLLGELGAQLTGTARIHRGLPPVRVRPEAAAARAAESSDAVLSVSGLSVTFPSPDGPVTPVRDVDLEVRPGEIVGLVGESGSGKSLTAAAVAQLVPYPGVVTADGMLLAGRDLDTLSGAELRRVLGGSLATVFQDPMTALNPTLRVGRQLAEVREVHRGESRKVALAKAVERIGSVQLDDPERRARQYPAELSGGMRQRVVIAQGLMAGPALILADEPTTALDVTVQRRILDLLRQVRDEDGTAVLLISHDLAVVAEVASRVLVMYAGRVVEELPAADLAGAAAHPYTRALIATVPDLGADRDVPLMSILRLQDLTVRLGAGRRAVTVVDRVSLEVPAGSVVGLVGESGSGKSTLARAVAGLVPCAGGEVTLDGRPLFGRAGRSGDGVGRRGPRPVHLVCQDPNSALDPRMRIGETIGEGVAAGGVRGRAERHAEVRRLLELVRLDPALASALPRHLSGGQRQRAALARGLAARPRVLVADEITSALDVSVQGAVLNLLREIQRELGLSVLFISHNLAVVRYLADSIAVMHAGRLVEVAPTEELIGNPRDPYTRSLLAAVPSLDMGRRDRAAEDRLRHSPAADADLG